MAYFPLCIDLTGKPVLLAGAGPQALEKEERLRPFGPALIRREAFRPEDLALGPVLVILADDARSSGAEAQALCARRNIPLNVVDMPEYCSFYFPALIAQGDLTVSVSTGGKNPGAAAWLRQQLRQAIPDRTGEILDSLTGLRARLKDLPPETRRPLLRRATHLSLSQNRPLTPEELEALIAGEAPDHAQ